MGKGWRCTGYSTTVIGTVLLKGVKFPVITRVPLTSISAGLYVLPASYFRYHRVSFTKPHQWLLAVPMQLCALRSIVSTVFGACRNATDLR